MKKYPEVYERVVQYQTLIMNDNPELPRELLCNWIRNSYRNCCKALASGRLSVNEVLASMPLD